MRRGFALPALLLPALVLAACGVPGVRDPDPSRPPNIVLIYTDDLGYGDLGSYGAERVETPSIDRLAAEGVRFTRAHATSATCTPSRYSLLTGEYAWRRPGTGIARGDAPLILDPARPTLASVLRDAGYRTAVVGKWHLGLGPQPAPDWNAEIRPGPAEVGFEESFILPATGDRVPTVYVQNGRVVGLDPSDPIRVSFSGPIGDEPTGAANPELLRVRPSHTHDQTIVDGISRIGYMTGGRAARWRDAEIADVITDRAVRFVEESRDRPFFLYFSTHDIHVPRVPHPRFVGATDMGPRGDVIAQLDASVSRITDALDRLGLARNTLVIFTSDNGPVLDDGYQDQAVERAGGHRPAGPLRGGKYSAFEAGTRVPFLVRWPGRVTPGVSDALLSQVDLPASLARLVGVAAPQGAFPDSRDQLQALLGRSSTGREHLVEQPLGNTLAIVRGRWKYIEPRPNAPRVNANTGIETGADPEPQLYDLEADPGERRNLAAERPELVRELADLLASIRRGADGGPAPR